jgi:DNA-binding response OmpR family regulator
MKLLIVEDDAGLARTVAVTLEIAFPDSHSTLAPDGKSALDGFYIERPDLVVLDVGLPDMDGFEVCRQLRESSNVPIIMLTGKDLVEDKVEGLTCGADDYIVKPFTPLEFIARAKAVLRRSQMGERKEPQPMRPNPTTAEERIVDYLRSHPEGTDFATAKKVIGLGGMHFAKFVARLQDADKVSQEGLLLFAATQPSG